MIKFLIKGLFRDRSRFGLPVFVVGFGVFILVVLTGLMDGMLNNMVNTTANFTTGHLKVMTKAYMQEKDQNPIDLALLDLSDLEDELKNDFPDYEWTPRVNFGILMDILDDEANSIAQSPVIGFAYDLLADSSLEYKRIGLDRAIVDGESIENQGQILVTKDLASRYDLHNGSIVSLLASDMYGSMSFVNMEVVGVVNMGINALDRGSVVMDIRDAQNILNMNDGATTLLGFSDSDMYDAERCDSVCAAFNASVDPDDEYSPYMISLREQNGMDELITYMRNMSSMVLFMLLFALSLVLWNTGILSGIRRYGEFGVRIAIGENKWHIFGTLMTESFFIGLIGSVVGTVLGLLVNWYLYAFGIDYSAMLENVSMNINPIICSAFSPKLFFIGFIPGVLSVMLGSALASIGMFKRKTSNLFKELD